MCFCGSLGVCMVWRLSTIVVGGWLYAGVGYVVEMWVFRVYVLLLCAVCVPCVDGYVRGGLVVYRCKVCRYGRIWTDLSHVGFMILLVQVTRIWICDL